MNPRVTMLQPWPFADSIDFIHLTTSLFQDSLLCADISYNPSPALAPPSFAALPLNDPPPLLLPRSVPMRFLFKSCRLAPSLPATPHPNPSVAAAAPPPSRAANDAGPESSLLLLVSSSSSDGNGRTCCACRTYRHRRGFSRLIWLYFQPRQQHANAPPDFVN